MTEKQPIGDFRPRAKEIPLPPETAKELGEIVPKPDTHFHYRIAGDWQQNREVYRVMEGDKVISDYTFPDKSDTSKVQMATRKTYAKEVNILGGWSDRPVQFDKKTGTWKKLNVFQRVKQAFTKETDIPAVIVTDTVDGKEVSVLHTLEQKRPVGETVKEAKITTLADAEADLGLKYKHVEHKLKELQHDNAVLRTQAATSAALIANLRREVAVSNRRVADLTAQLRVQQSQAQTRTREADPHYEGPIHTKPDPNDVVEGEVIG